MTEPQEATLLLHLSSFCLPSVSPLHTWLSCHSRSSSLSSPLLFSLQSKQQTSLFCFFLPPSLSLTLSSLPAPTVTYQLQPSCPPSVQSSILLFLCPVHSGYMLTVTHLPFSLLPSLLQLYSTPFLFFPSPFAFLYLVLSRLAFTMTDLSSLLYANRSPVS